MITVILLHPTQNVPLQSWYFDQEDIISIGRASTNDIVVYSAVVSRNHVQLKKNGEDWQCINVGANGTFINGERINQVKLEDGMIIRLADTGPKIQVKIGEIDQNQRKPQGKRKALSEHDHIDTFIRDLS